MPSTPVVIPGPVGLGRDTTRRRAARARLASVLWDREGRRRLPGELQLRRAIEACDRRDLWWVCEMNSAGPLYFLPTREWLRALARELEQPGVRLVLEVGAGDGFLARCLREACPRLRVVATDDASWANPRARMSPAERRAYASLPVPRLELGPEVEKLEALKAVRRHRPDVVLVSWAPPGTLVERLIRCGVASVVEIGATGDACGSGQRTWRFAHEPLVGPLESRALCRLDSRPGELRHTRVTRYFGA